MFYLLFLCIATFFLVLVSHFVLLSFLLQHPFSFEQHLPSRDPIVGVQARTHLMHFHTSMPEHLRYISMCYNRCISSCYTLTRTLRYDSYHIVHGYTYAALIPFNLRG
jgi:hypothetical protein